MFKLIKYLKNSYISILLIIALLVGQAICDLALPDYTSKIINVGVQQGGIENGVFEAIRESEIQKLKLFINEKDWKIVEQNYKKINKQTLSESEYKKYQKKYPILESEPIYILKEIDEKTEEKLNNILNKPSMIVMMLGNNTNESQIIIGKLEEQIGTIPNGKTIFDALETIPEKKQKEITTNIESQLSNLPETIIEQSATAYVKIEYTSIGMNTDKIQTNYILISGAKMLGIALLSMTATIMVGFLGARVAARLGKEMRGKVFKKVVSFSNTEMKQFSTASLITRSTNDIQQVQMLMVMLIRTVFYAPIVGIGAVIKVVNQGTNMSWIIAVAVMTIMTLVLTLFAIVMPKFKKMQTLIDRLNLVTREILTGLPVIRAFSKERHEEKRFDKANKDLVKNFLFVTRVMAFMMPAMMFIMNGVSILIVWKGAHAIDAGALQVGDMMAFIQYTMQIIMSFLMISMISIMIPRATVSASRIDEIITTIPSIKDPIESKPLDPKKKGYVEFKNVSFKYPDADTNIIENISFTARPGETTAFIGSTGSGKSTLINLIPRFFDVSEGSITIDGVDIREINQKDLHSKIGYIPQQGILFTGDIKSNITYGNKKATKKDIEKAIKVSQSKEFIDSKKEGLNYPIAQGGTNVSGGQKQRLSIARAIATNPEIYIFDDSFSALDFKTDAALRKALKETTKDSTVLIVAQRISTIMNAEQIIVLDEGKIVGIGTHEQLLKKCSIYKQIAESQLGKEEL